MRKQLDRIRIGSSFLICSGSKYVYVSLSALVSRVTSKESEPKYLHHAPFRGATIINDYSSIVTVTYYVYLKNLRV